MKNVTLHVIALLIVWGFLCVLQWGGLWIVGPKFFHFRAWEWVLSPEGMEVPFRPLAHWNQDSIGDLGHAAGYKALFQPHFQRFQVDEYGFRNPPGSREQSPDIVIAGDSLAAGSRLHEDETVAGLLRENGFRIYSYAGLKLEAVFSDRFLTNHPPRIFVVMLAERRFNERWLRIGDAAPGGFSAYSVELPYSPYGKSESITLRTLLEVQNQFSLLRHFSKVLYRNMLFALGLHDFSGLVHSIDLNSGHLFLAENVNSLAGRGNALRYGSKSLDALVSIQARLESQGVHLVVVVIPDKELIYRAAILRPSEAEGLPAITIWQKELKALNISYLDLYSVYLEHRKSGVDKDALYFKDDTHISPLGARLLAEQLQQMEPLQELLPSE